MKNHTSIKLVRKLEVADLEGDKVMVDFRTGKYFWLKGIANDIWEYLCSYEKIEISYIIDQLLKEYEVDRETCDREVRAFLEHLVEIKFAKYC
ncbi:MAG: PqqD family peptide modification chaperone [Clostridiales bacterium]|nr:PqqD family peptide modification chaperone [Clostridiales bacterium]